MLHPSNTSINAFSSPVQDPAYSTAGTIQNIVSIWNERLTAKRLTNPSYWDHTRGITKNMNPLDIMAAFDNQDSISDCIRKNQ